MKKKSILVSLVVAILAAMTFVGCSDSVVYPKTVTDAKITQIGDFLTGQNFDSNKFEVEVTYLDGSSSKTVGSVSLDSASAGIVSKDSYVTYTATDIKGNDIYRELSVSVYDIDKIEVTGGPESYSATVGENPKIGQNTDYVVTASYYANGVAKTMPLSSNEYTVTFNAYDAGKAPEEAAEAVGATLKVETAVGGSKDFLAPIQVTVTDKPVTPVVVEEITAVSWNGNFMPFNYAELPEIAFEDVNVSAKVEDETDPVTLTEDPGIEFSFVDATTHRPIRSLDLTQTANQDDLAIRAEYDGVVVFGNVTGYSDVDISVTYESDAKFVRGEAIPAINPADYIVTMVVDGGDPEELTLDASAFMYMSKSQEYKGTTVPEGTDPLGVRVNYNGIYSATYAFTAKELVTETPEIESVEFEMVATWKAPAYQNYDAKAFEALVLGQDAVKSMTITMSDGKPTTLTKYDFNWAYYTAEGVKLLDAEPTAEDDYDVLADATTILVGATYNDVTYYQEYELNEPENIQVKLTADYGDVAYYEAPIDWTISLYNTNGTIDADYTGAYTSYAVTGADADRKVTKADLPNTLGAAGTYMVAVVIDGEPVASADVPLAAGTEWYEVDGITVTYTGEKVFIDDVLTTKVKASSFKIEGFDYHGADEEPTLAAASVSFADEDELASATNTAYVKVTYTGKDLKPHDKIVEVSIPGNPWGSINNLKLVWAKDKTEVTAANLKAGSYNYNDFAVTGFTPHGDTEIKLIITKQNVTEEITSGVFNLGVAEWIQFDYEYTAQTGLVESSTPILRVDAAPASN